MPLAVIAAEGIADLNVILQNSKKYDQQHIEFNGEVIGDKFKDGEKYWINISDGKNVIGVWIEKKLSQKIRYFGDYKHIGDQVRISGVFNRGCKEHGGDIDIHADKLVLLKAGSAWGHKISPHKLYLAILLTMVVVFLVLMYSVRR